MNILLKLWAKHMPGSIGSIAKAMCRTYNDMKNEFPDARPQDLLKLTLESRLWSLHMAKQLVPDKDIAVPDQDIVFDLIRALEKHPSLSWLIEAIIHWERPEVAELDSNQYEELKSLIQEIVRENTTKEVW